MAQFVQVGLFGCLMALFDALRRNLAHLWRSLNCMALFKASIFMACFGTLWRSLVLHGAIRSSIYHFMALLGA